MSHETKELLVDANGRPIPQYFDDELGDYVRLGKPASEEALEELKAEVAALREEFDARKEYRGLSTDTKPTEDIPLYATFLEMDTKDVFYFDGTEWQVM